MLAVNHTLHLRDHLAAQRPARWRFVLGHQRAIGPTHLVARQSRICRLAIEDAARGDAHARRVEPHQFPRCVIERGAAGHLIENSIEYCAGFRQGGRHGRDGGDGGDGGEHRPQGPGEG